MDTEEKLIVVVQQYQCLYKSDSTYYMNKQAKNNAWEKVSAEMKISAPDCQKLWKKIRDSYRKSIQSKQNRSGSARTNDRPIRFEKELEFIKPYLQKRPQISNLASPPEDSSTDAESQFELSAESSSVPSPRPKSTLSNFTSTSHNEQQSPKMSNMLYEQYLISKENDNDPTLSFFMTMGRTVRLMPQNIQAKIKREIFRIVNEAEIMLSDECRDFNDGIPSTTKNTTTLWQTFAENSVRTPTSDNSHPNSLSTFAPPPPPPPVDNIYSNQTSVAPPLPPSPVDNIYSNQTLSFAPPPPPSPVDNNYYDETLSFAPQSSLNSFIKMNSVKTSLAANETGTVPQTFSYNPSKICTKKSTVTRSYETPHAANRYLSMDPPSPYIPSSALTANETGTAPKTLSYNPSKICTKKSTVTRSCDTPHAANRYSSIDPPSSPIPSSVSRQQSSQMNMSESLEYEYNNM